MAPALNVILLGEAEAAHIGVKVAALKRSAIVLAVICAACSVALAGVIGFIGLMVPHMLRMLMGPDHRGLMTLSFLGGAALLPLADPIARIPVKPAQISGGILGAPPGAPVFTGMLLH